MTFFNILLAIFFYFIFKYLFRIITILLITKFIMNLKKKVLANLSKTFEKKDAKGDTQK
jgi:hypothetical protein